MTWKFAFILNKLKILIFFFSQKKKKKNRPCLIDVSLIKKKNNFKIKLNKINIYLYPEHLKIHILLYN